MPRPLAATSRRLWLVRHGLTSWNAEGRWQGGIDVELSEAGRAQARALGERMSAVSLQAAFSSDLVRARETALLAAPGVAKRGEEPLLRELSYGAWEGVRDVDVGERWPEERATWWSRPDEIRPGGGESLQELQDRSWRGLLACLRDSEGDVLVVAHGGVNRVLLATILGLPLARFWAVHQDPTAVNVVEMPPGPADEALSLARVRLLNCTRHLSS